MDKDMDRYIAAMKCLLREGAQVSVMDYVSLNVYQPMKIMQETHVMDTEY